MRADIDDGFSDDSAGEAVGARLRLALYRLASALRAVLGHDAYPLLPSLLPGLDLLQHAVGRGGRLPGSVGALAAVGRPDRQRPHGAGRRNRGRSSPQFPPLRTAHLRLESANSSRQLDARRTQVDVVLGILRAVGSTLKPFADERCISHL